MKFFIEGNIGSGKSTLVKYLKNLKLFENDNIKTVLEPVNEWKDFTDNKGKNVLEYFYTDPKRWGYLFQMNAFITRSKLIEEVSSNCILLMERSVYSDRNVFAKNCYEKGLINDIEWKTYLNWFEWLSKKISVNGDAYIYLRTSPEKSYQRIQKRGRDEEKEISLDYIKEIHQKHEEWLKNAGPNVLILDGDLENSEQRLQDFAQRILTFIKSFGKISCDFCDSNSRKSSVKRLKTYYMPWEKSTHSLCGDCLVLRNKSI